MAGKLTCVNIEVTQPSSVAGGSIVGPDSSWNTTMLTGAKVRKFPDGTVEVVVTGNPVTGSLNTGYQILGDNRFAAPIAGQTEMGHVVLSHSDFTFFDSTGKSADPYIGSIYRFYADA